MQSKTSDALKYTVSLGDINVEIIDTPGLGDSKGIEQDKKHVTKIIDTLKKEDYVNCVCLIVNGRSSRMSATLSYVLSEITSILPKTILNNIIVVFTNTTGLLQLSFDLGALKHYFGQNLEHSYYIENPYCLFEKANKKKGLMSKELLAESLKDEFERTAKTLNKLFATMKSFELVQTNNFLQLYEKKEKIEVTVAEALKKYDTQLEITAEIEKKEKEISDAVSKSQYNEKYKERQTSTCRESISTSHHNTICTAKECFSTCHEHCILPRTVEAINFKSCIRMNGDYCTVCGHHYSSHQHLYVKYIDVERVWWTINADMERRFLEAKNDKERATLLKKELQEKHDAIIKEKEKLFEILNQAIKEFQALGINHSFKKVLKNQVSFIEHHLEGQADLDPNSSGAKRLEESRKELKKKIEIIKELKSNFQLLSTIVQ
ncbi:PREDICTED: uncharacterized protein LOC105313388 [Amphimedon queenslandica]|uniref:AIG1-type G domain-containing protein n=1 Tax=Amphimedon queenslandica TaxID=400682 RepID=A0A1X7UHA4_AMPQE|nr:PREDICTED: uncharacterized protein LOC105313388 [Amphimedon queenslandica]|eukprot:XP_011405076.1 PREDICTED: uncharacterized protein LOC105313388 [Amphimedon queenslandica]